MNTLADLLIVSLFGFPAVIVSLLLSALGVWKKKYGLVLVGAGLFVPFAYYLSGGPGTYRLPLLLPLFQVFSALAVRAKQSTRAWWLLLPGLLAALYILSVALYFQFQ